MATLDASVVNIALPTLTKALGAEVHHVKWVIIIYLLAITCLLLPFGRLADQFGRRRTFQVGFAVFTLGSLFCGMSNSLTSLVMSRFIQGIGGAMLMANGPALITSHFSPQERGKALGTLAMVVSLGLVTGPTIGGLLISYLGWKSIFYINIPIGLAGVVIARTFIEADPKRQDFESFDWAGSLLQSVALVGFISLLEPPAISISGGGLVHIPRWVVGIGFAIVVALFLKIESESRAPILDLELFKIRTFWSGNLSALLMFVAYSGMVVLMPFYLEEVLKLETRVAGFYMSMIPMAVFVVAPISGRLSDRIGSRDLSMFGSMMLSASLWCMAELLDADGQVTHAQVLILLGSVGISTGLFQAPNNNAIMSSVPPQRLGVASACLATVRNLGLVTGTGLASAFVAQQNLLPHLQTVNGPFVSSLHRVLYAGSALAAAAAIASFGKDRGPSSS